MYMTKYDTKTFSKIHTVIKTCENDTRGRETQNGTKSVLNPPSKSELYLFNTDFESKELRKYVKNTCNRQDGPGRVFLQKPKIEPFLTQKQHSPSQAQTRTAHSRFGGDQVHTEGVSMWHDSDSVSHHAFFVEGGVTIEDNVISIL